MVQLFTIFNTVTCCIGAIGYTIKLSVLYNVSTVTKRPNDTFIRICHLLSDAQVYYPRQHICCGEYK